MLIIRWNYKILHMSEIEEFVSQTLQEGKTNLEEFREFQKILKQLSKKRKTILLSYVTSSTT